MCRLPEVAAVRDKETVGHTPLPLGALRGDGYERISVDTDTDNWVKNADQAIPGSHIRPVNAVMSVPRLSHANNIGSGIWGMASGDMDLEAGVTQILASVADSAGAWTSSSA